MFKFEKIAEVCSRFAEQKILVYGDIILDRYIFGQVERISPEAPVPVVKVDSEEMRLGGAGNVAANIDQLGAQGLLLGVAKKNRQLGDQRPGQPDHCQDEDHFPAPADRAHRP
jgi:bifunctional ADP-heptose synthase (sugar kinase/adenylyltransferase)